MSYIRNVTFQIKPGKTQEFNKVLSSEVLPIMKQQAGFKHELAMVNGSYAVGLSVWQDQPSAEKYQTSAYPEVLKKLSPVIEGTPKVTNFEMAASTLPG
jgi:quinol monooxygenase YgiN